MNKEKNCLNCFHEPKWGEWRGTEYRRQVGKCRFKVKLPVLPAVYSIFAKPIIKYSDDSGTITQCKVWCPK